MNNEIHNYKIFEKIFISTLDKHAPFRQKANQAPYITKSLRKAIIRRSQMQTKYFKNKSQSNYLLFKKSHTYEEGGAHLGIFLDIY